MQKKKHGDLFWLLLGMFNSLVVCYPLICTQGLVRSVHTLC